MDFYTNGDVAPGARFKYQFTTVGAQTSDTETDTAESDPSAPDTEIPAETPAETNPPKREGCRSAISAAILPVTMAVALVSKKKRKDQW